MKKKPAPSTAAAKLRRQANARLRERPDKPVPAFGERPSAADAWRLLHELQVHQVELEMQKAELQEARDRMEALWTNTPTSTISRRSAISRWMNTVESSR